MDPQILEQQPVQQSSLKEHIIDLIQTLVVFLAIGLVIYFIVAQPHRVSGKSMYPTFDDDNYIITDKLSYRFADPKHGDIVVFKNPKDKSQDFIKRIIAVPGDTIKVLKGQVYLNGEALDEKYLRPDIITEPNLFLKEDEEVVVSENNYIAMGDNRLRSSDSREWGFVTKEEIIGKVFLRYWPKDVIGLYPGYEGKN